MTVAKPLDRFSLVRAHHIDSAQEALSKVYSNRMKLELLERNGIADITVNSCELLQTGLNYTGYGAGVSVKFSGSKFVTLSFPISGSGKTVIGGTERLLGPQCGLITPADIDFAANLSVEYEHVVLRMKPKALKDKLSALVGEPIDGALQFDPLMMFSESPASLLRDHFLFLVDMVGLPAAPIPPLLQAEFEQSLMVMFLCASRHRYSRLLEREASDVAPAEVRLAEGYIEANWHQPLTLEGLAEVTGVSAFSLFRSFKRYRGYTPLQFVERVRNWKRAAR